MCPLVSAQDLRTRSDGDGSYGHAVGYFAHSGRVRCRGADHRLLVLVDGFDWNILIMDGSSLKELKPSFRQRFLTISMTYLPPEREAQVLINEAGNAPDV